MRRLSIAVIVASTGLAACVSQQPPTPAPPVAAPAPVIAVKPEVITVPKYIDNSCVMFKPVYPSPRDILTPGTAVQIANNNDTGQAKCGWKPPVKNKKKPAAPSTPSSAPAASEPIPASE
jgi:hypothetical protein